MYHSHSYQNEVFDYFVTFLKNAIAGNESYAALVQPIISDAHLLAAGQKDYYAINRDGYSIITYLAETDKDYFENLNPENLSVDDYNRILQIANSQREAFFA